MSRALITGITGFAGSHLADHLLEKGLEVYGIQRRRSKQDNILHIRDWIKLIYADLSDSFSIEEAIKEAQPDYVFHLAAQAYVPMSLIAPEETMQTNVIGTINLLESIRKSSTDPIIHVAGSSDEYGTVLPEEIPVTEDNPLRPASPYAVSKVAQDLTAAQYHRSYGMRIVRTRAFNHAGPRMDEAFVASSFAKQIAEIESKSKPPVIYVGNLSSRRDFLDVRDVVKAYLLAVQKCRPGEVYNICSEKVRTIQSVLDLIISFSNVKGIKVKQDPARMRPSDVAIIQGSCEKFRNETGWKMEIPFEKTAKDLLDYWRENVSCTA